jgi:hypothetical protein
MAPLDDVQGRTRRLATRPQPIPLRLLLVRHHHLPPSTETAESIRALELPGA